MRKAIKERKTTETQVRVELNIDGTGKSSIDTGIGLLNHMLELFAFWGLFDLNVKAKGDINRVDMHHTNEDVGIVLGQAFKEALGDKKGINRVGSASVPMEEVVADVVADISGRGSFKIVKPGKAQTDAKDEKDYDLKDAEHFFEALAKQLGMNLNIKIDPVSSDLHTTLEPVFKALGKALAEATQIDPRRQGIPSTKGVID